MPTLMRATALIAAILAGAVPATPRADDYDHRTNRVGAGFAIAEWY